MKSPELLCLAYLPGPLQTEEMEIAFWSPLIIYNNRLAGLPSEPDCCSSAHCSFFAVLSETAEEITVEVTGDVFSAPVCCEDRVLVGMLATEMIA